MSTTVDQTLAQLLQVIKRHWGYHSLRPLQEQAMRAVLAGRDSVVVLPTGGGKSLCYQAPAVVRGDITVVVSPLIALMKDQVDGLHACGVPALQISSAQSPEERHETVQRLRARQANLVFASPERLVMTDFQQLLRQCDVRNFAIDESHCISHWGHDFRPEYRQMRCIKEIFPEASVHAYTATATEQVRSDIAAQLALRDPLLLVGDFDRPNLTYRVLPRHDQMKQITEVLERHKDEAGIIYCMRRRDVDDLTTVLKTRGYDARAYHAGMSSMDRTRTQEAFASEECNLIVATVAFGMGIDRSNLRFVLHTAMPKSIVHYQQETGRAGRDGLGAECVLLHSGHDVMTWKFMLEKSAQEQEMPPGFLQSAMKHLNDMDAYARGVVCRHKALVEYFGQQLDTSTCGACDLCLHDTQEVTDALLIAQKILSCVARVKERFGMKHVITVLRGEQTPQVLQHGHDKLTTFNLLAEHKREDLRDWIYQLLSQKALRQHDFVTSDGMRMPLLGLTAESWEVMQGKRQVRLLQLVRRKRGEKAATSKADDVSWEGVDRGLFDQLRELRRMVALEIDKPAYVVFSDATLRELARCRPQTLQAMRLIYGIGDNKLTNFGERFLSVIQAYCAKHGLSSVAPGAAPPPAAAREELGVRALATREPAFALFRQKVSVTDVAERLGKAVSAVNEMLADFIRLEKPASLAPWLALAKYQQIKAAADKVGLQRLKPIFVELGEQVPYDEIRVVVTHLQALQGETVQ